MPRTRNEVNDVLRRKGQGVCLRRSVVLTLEGQVEGQFVVVLHEGFWVGGFNCFLMVDDDMQFIPIGPAKVVDRGFSKGLFFLAHFDHIDVFPASTDDAVLLVA